ncbi:hypothetical protein [Kitasatospora sp. NPDC091207]|uniref:hypothetical protein n=1 Tax=Kitasatospora sp. NPDC091207 TaxID=3364083 RepID=UPI0038068162
MVLLTWIAEVADEPLVLEPADRRVEWETNTWWLSAEVEDRRSLSVSEVVAAFERTASALRVRIRELGFPGVATFYVWHDDVAGQLRCSTGSVPPDELPFGGAYVPSDDLGSVVEGFLADSNPGVITLSDSDELQDSEQIEAAEPEIAAFPVWVSSVGAASPGSDL